MPTPAHVASTSDDVLVVGCGAAAACAVLALGCRPTGSPAVDVVLVVGAVGIAVWASAAARWWALVLLGVAATALAGEVWGGALGALAVLSALVLGWLSRPNRLLGAASSALSVVALATIGDLGRFGLSSAVALALVATCAVLGLWGLARPTRRKVLIGLGVVGAVVLVAVGGLLIAALAARSDLDGGNRSATAGLASVREGDIEAARLEFADASVQFRRAADDLRRPWAQLARVVPVAAQHRVAAAELSDAAATASRTLEAELRSVDLDALRIVDGRIDVEAVVALQEPMGRLNTAIERLDVVVASVQSGWLIEPVGRRLDELAGDLAQQRSLGAKAADALAVAPAMLGADGERVYFVMFTTPAEARGQGGFMGNYAELTIDDGRIELASFGRHGDLSTGGDRPRTIDDAPADWIARYGPFGFTTGPDRTVGDVPWANITMSPHFPSTARVAAELYPQSGGRAVDGVVSLDVFALEQIVGLVGPLDVPGAPEPLHGGNTASFLLVDQYDIDDIDARTDLLEAVALEAVDRLLDGAVDDPVELGRQLQPMVRQRRLMSWSVHPDEQTMLVGTGMAGGLLADRGDADGVAVTVVNASGNKIDTYLGREFAVVKRDDGDQSTFDLQLLFDNDPPPGLPDYVVGNLVGLPRGSSRLFVSVHTSLRLVSARDSSGSLGLQASVEAGLPVYSGYLDLGPGSREVWSLVLESERPASDAEFRLQPQPLVEPEVWRMSLGDAPRSEGEIGELTESETFVSPAGD